MPTRREMLQGAGALVGAAALGDQARAANANQSVAAVWADAIAKARYEDLSPAVVKSTKLCLLDNLGVLAHTSTLAEARAFLARSLRNGGPREATVWGVGAKLPLETAVYCNAYLIHGNEIDDSDFRSNYRPSCVSLPAPLSVAEFAHASGKDLLLAAAIAYSVNGRLAAQLRGLQGLGWMPSSVVGAGGAAAATAKLLKYDAATTQSAMALGIGGGGGLFQYYFDQTEDKKLHVARAARAGVEVALLAKQGWLGPANVVEGAAGLLPSYLRGTTRQPDYDWLKRDFAAFEGPRFVYPKFFSASSSITPFLEALQAVYRREKLTPEQLEKFIVVDWQLLGPFKEKIVHFEPPQTITGAQMNMNFAVALFLQRGSASVYDFTEAALRDARVLALAGRADFEQVPEGSESAIKLVLRDGRTLSAPFRKDAGAAPPPERLDWRLEKFATLTRDRLTEAARQRVREMVEEVDTVRDVAVWTAALQRLLKPLKTS